MSLSEILTNLFGNILVDVFENDLTAFTVCVVSFSILTVLEYIVSLITKQFNSSLGL